MNHQNNINRIKTVYNALGGLQNEVVFVGGATISLYADRQAFEIRETDDVDVIIELLNYAHHADLENQLRQLFKRCGIWYNMSIQDTGSYSRYYADNKCPYWFQQ